MLVPRKSRRVGAYNNDPGGVDTYFDNTLLLLHADGASGSTNSIVSDQSSNSFTVSGSGAGQGSFSPFCQNGWSVAFNGTSDYLSVPASSAFAFGTGDFTIECWIWISTDIGTKSIEYGLDQSGKLLAVVGDYKTSTGLNFLLYVTNSTINFSHSGGTVSKSASLGNDRWHHIAVTRSSSTLRMYVNGSKAGTDATVTTNITNNNSVIIGGNNNDLSSTWLFQGYISNLRVIKGSALYTGATYTVPTGRLTVTSDTSLLTLRNGALKDISTNGFTVTQAGSARVMPWCPFAPTTRYNTETIGGSLSVGGTGVTLPNNTIWNFQANPFTVEAWIYLTSLSGSIASHYTNPNGWQFGITASGELRLLYNNAATVVTPTNSVGINQWHHVALVSDGTNFKIYVDGTSKVSSAVVSITDLSAVLSVGSFSGFISGFRISTIAVYTADFALPNRPPTDNGATQALINFTGAAVYDSTGRINLSGGSAPLSSTQSRYGGTSLYFDGSSYFKLTSGIVSSFCPTATEDWTVEFWFYPLDRLARVMFAYVSDPLPAGNGVGRGFSIAQLNSSGFLRLNQAYGYGASGVSQNSNAPALNTWSHIAIVKYSDTIDVYQDGTLRFTSGHPLSGTTNYAMWIGYGPGTVNSTTLDLDRPPFYGYIDELRYTKGVRRYTGAFNSPTRHGDK